MQVLVAEDAGWRGDGAKCGWMCGGGGDVGGLWVPRILAELMCALCAITESGLPQMVYIQCIEPQEMMVLHLLILACAYAIPNRALHVSES